MPFTSTLFGALSGLGVRMWANVMYKKRLLFREYQCLSSPLLSDV
jgi:hypothetical protein